MRTALRAISGFTLLETMVAIIILTVGLLAVARVTAMALRLSADGQARWTGALLARSRLELLRSGRCASGSGTDASSGMLLRWTAAGAPGRMSLNAVLTAVPQQSRVGTTRPDTFVANLTCR